MLSAAATEAAIATNRVDANVASSRIVRIFQPICFSSHNNRDGGCVLMYHSLHWGGKGCVHRRRDWQKGRNAGHGSWGGCRGQLGDVDFSFLGGLVVKVVDGCLHAEHLVMVFLGG